MQAGSELTLMSSQQDGRKKTREKTNQIN